MRNESQPGTCTDLPTEVQDKYFMSNGNTERFESAVARAICQRCPALIGCLESAIVNPPQQGIRGAETAGTLNDLHRAWLGGRALDGLVDESLDRQKPLGGLRQHRALRWGKFRTVKLAVPSLGGSDE